MSSWSRLLPIHGSSDKREKRSEDTRHALILAGLELFGEYGLKGTTTRMLCQASGANLAAIAYHFTNKEGLYLAVAEYISARMQLHLSSPAEELISKTSSTGFSRPSGENTFGDMIDKLAHLMAASDEVRTWARIIVREQARPTAAFHILYHGAIERLQIMLARLICRVHRSRPSIL
ncbi:MAG: CerR family C-terminal domain-containing protein [Candidatus Synoicihabitans palmerolidicus]|nr:CerR family C-terminal domain-containing protein [Candidatus Synoicihabitans palmerolidicus]